MWPSDLEFENELVVIWGQYYSELEGSYEYTGRFCLTSVKMEELISMIRPFSPENELKFFAK
jgi:hypothetical protein